MLSNQICRLVIGQFDNQYLKATINFNSIHRKTLCGHMMFIDIPLAIMIYCNHTELSDG